MKYSLSPLTAVLLLLLTVVGCKPDPAIITPPPPPVPEVFPDCSYSFTTPVHDTVFQIPWEVPGGAMTDFYEEYEVKDICFNPNDPNELIVVIGYRNGYSSLLKVNLCTGVEFLMNHEFSEFESADWGTDDVILLGTEGGVYTIHSNGDSLANIFHNISPVDVNTIWCPDQESFLISGSYPIIFKQVEMDGSILNDCLGTIADHDVDFSYLPDGRLCYYDNGIGIGIYDFDSETTEWLDQSFYPAARSGMDYSPYHKAVLWSNDSIVALTGLENGETTILSRGSFTTNFIGAAASKNGYLAYIAHVMSAGLTTGSSWMYRTEIRFINPDGTDERRLVLDFE